jgi:hypothetical protein
MSQPVVGDILIRCFSKVRLLDVVPSPNVYPSRVRAANCVQQSLVRLQWVFNARRVNRLETNGLYPF